MKASALFFLLFFFLNKSKLSGFSPLGLSLLGSASTELCPRVYFSVQLPVLGEDQEHCTLGQSSQDHPLNNGQIHHHPMPLPLESQPSLLHSMKAPSPEWGAGHFSVSIYFSHKAPVLGVELAKVLTMASCRTTHPCPAQWWSNPISQLLLPQR